MTTFSTIALAAVLLACAASTALGQEIKGVEIGKEPPVTPVSSIAEIPEKYGQASTELVGGKVVQFSFFFASEGFDDMLAAIRTKYPAMKCANSAVVTGMGVRLTQTDCYYKTLHLARFVDDVHTSTVSMHDYKHLMSESRKGKAKAAADL